MTVNRFFKALIILGVINKSLAVSEKFAESHDSKYKFRYVEPNKDESNQAWSESRNGNPATHRYYVDRPIGNAHQDASVITTFSPTTFAPLFGTKLSKFNSATGKSAGPKLNYTPVPGGFYLTHESIDASNETTERPNYVAGLTSQTFSAYKDLGEKYSEGVVQSKANKQSFYPTSENVKNEIKQLHIQSTTPSIKTFEFSGSGFSTNPVETRRFSQLGQRVKIPSLAINPDRFSYSKEKSIEKTSFAPFDAKIISEVQKHAEQIIMKDLQQARNLKLQNDLSGFSPRTQQLTTVTMRPIVVSEGGEVTFKGTLSTTPTPEILKSRKNFQSDSMNAVKITEKIAGDPKLEDSGYFRVSVSPGLTSSITVAPATQQLIDAKSANRNSASNNLTLCESNLCDTGNVKIFYSQTLPEATTEKELEQLDPLVSGTKTNKITHNFYPKNEMASETHYVTTIDVQKGISLDVHQNEDGSIQLAENFPFNKLRPFQTQGEFNQPTPQSLVSVTPGIFKADTNSFTTSQKSYILNTVTTAPGLFDATANQNAALLQGFNDVSSNPVLVQDRIGNNRQGLENQLVSPVPSTGGNLQSTAQVTEDLSQVEKNIQELRQQILDSIDAQHEEEQRKQNLVDEERRQYFENLRKVEALKDQNSVSYNYDIKTQPEGIQSVVVSTPAPVKEKMSDDVTPKVPYFQALQPVPYQTEYKEINSQTQVQQVVPTFEGTPSQFPLVFSSVQTTPNPEIYSSQIDTFGPQTFQESTGGRKLALFNTQNVQNVNMYPESNSQQRVTDYNENNSQQTVSSNIGNPVQQVVPAYSLSSLQYVSPAFTGSLEQTISSFDDNSIQQTAADYTAQKADENDYVHQVTPVSSFSRYADSDKATQIPLTIQPQISLSGAKATEVAKQVLFNAAVPFDYNRLLRTSLSQGFPITTQTKTPTVVPAIYAIPQPIAVSIPMQATYKLLAFPEVSSVGNKQYHTTLMQKPNKLRVQPLKPSTPSEDSQKEAIQNLLSQPQFHRTYFYAGLPYTSRLQLRQIGQNQISNSEQVRPQILTRRGKSLKNLRIEYGFKPPLRPSVEFSEEVKPSIYGPSVPPQ